jgi:hypothetical protein
MRSEMVSGSLDMPNWLLALICLIAIIAFVGYAFYQGTKVKPDENNRNVGPNHAGQGLSDGGDGHSGF